MQIICNFLLQHSESHKHATHHDEESPLSAGLEGSRRVLLIVGARARAAAAARVITRAGLVLALVAAGHVGVDGCTVVSGTSTGLGDAAARSRLSDVGSLGVLGTARVVLTAGRCAFHVAGAGLDTLGTPFSADKVGQCQRVLGDVGLKTIATDTAVGESFLHHMLVKGMLDIEVMSTYRVALIDFGGSIGNLLADNGACLLLLLTPDLCNMLATWLFKYNLGMSRMLTSVAHGNTTGINVVVGGSNCDERGGNSQNGRSEKHRELYRKLYRSGDEYGTRSNVCESKYV